MKIIAHIECFLNIHIFVITQQEKKYIINLAFDCPYQQDNKENKYELTYCNQF